eukprot:9046721-Prorocentrum_lima.AAC.1
MAGESSSNSGTDSTNASEHVRPEALPVAGVGVVDARPGEGVGVVYAPSPAVIEINEETPLHISARVAS